MDQRRRLAVNDALLGRVREAITHSELLQAAAAIAEDGGRRFALGDAPLRHLSPDEIEILTAQGNSAENWSNLLVGDGFNPRRVRHCDFLGEVVLGCFTGKAQLGQGVEVPTGLYRSTIADCVIGSD